MGGIEIEVSVNCGIFKKKRENTTYVKEEILFFKKGEKLFRKQERIR